MVVGVCRLTLLVSFSHSLKEKRGVVRKIKDRVRTRFNVAIAEIGGQDSWQRAVLALAAVGHDRNQVRQILDRVVAFIVDLGFTDVAGDEREILVYGEGHMSGPDLDDYEGGAQDDSWIPDEWKQDEES